MKYFFWVASTPAILKCLHVRVTLSSSLFAQAFHVVATLLHQLSKPEAKTLLFLSQSLGLCLQSAALLFPICGSVWPSDRSMPMWLSSPQGTVQVSRRGWRVHAQSVTNAFGWSADPRGPLFHSSVGTWRQSLQELFKGEELYQSQPMLLCVHPSHSITHL